MPASLGLSRSLPDRSRFGGDSLPAPGGRAGFKYYADRGLDLIGTAFSRAGHRGGIRSGFGKSKPAITAVASERKIIWVRPEEIVFKIVGDHSLHPNDILSGDWDLRRAVIAETRKHSSVWQHFQDGRPWEETALFASYGKRIGRGELVRGADNLEQLKREYETRVDAAFADIQANGFRIARDLLGRPTNLPHVHIGRDGEILYGTRGNHRLAMAKLLSLSVIPCHVRARHANWQKVREAVLNAVILTKDGAPAPDAAPAFREHPDLADLYFPNE